MLKRRALKLTIQEMQKLHLEILATFADVCEKNNIHYLLCGGNALGAVRHGGPIPWDYDVDVMVPENQIDVLCDCLRKALDPKFFVAYHRLKTGPKIHFPRIGLTGYDLTVFHIDIFRLVGFPDNAKEQAEIYRKAKALDIFIAIKLALKTRTAGKTALLYCLKLAFFWLPTEWLLKPFDALCSRHPYEEAAYAGYLVGQWGIRNMFRRDLFDEYIMINYAGISMRIVKEYDVYLTRLYGDYTRLPPQKERNSFLNKTYVINKRRS